MSKTTNYGLEKYDDNMNCDFRFINGSLDKIDEKMKKANDIVETIEKNVTKMTDKGIKEYLGSLNLSNTSPVLPRPELIVDTTKYSAIEFHIYIDKGSIAATEPQERIRLTINDVLIDEFRKAEYRPSQIRYEAYLNNNSNGYIYTLYEWIKDDNVLSNPNFRTRNYILPKDKQSTISLYHTIQENKYYFNAYVYVVGIY